MSALPKPLCGSSSVSCDIQRDSGPGVLLSCNHGNGRMWYDRYLDGGAPAMGGEDTDTRICRGHGRTGNRRWPRVWHSIC